VRRQKEKSKGNQKDVHEYSFLTLTYLALRAVCAGGYARTGVSASCTRNACTLGRGPLVPEMILLVKLGLTTQ